MKPQAEAPSRRTAFGAVVRDGSSICDFGPSSPRTDSVPPRHCEERSDEAIQGWAGALFRRFVWWQSWKDSRKGAKIKKARRGRACGYVAFRSTASSNPTCEPRVPARTENPLRPLRLCANYPQLRQALRADGTLASFAQRAQRAQRCNLSFSASPALSARNLRLRGHMRETRPVTPAQAGAQSGQDPPQSGSTLWVDLGPGLRRGDEAKWCEQFSYLTQSCDKGASLKSLVEARRNFPFPDTSKHARTAGNG